MAIAINYPSQVYGTANNNVSIDTSYAERMRDNISLNAGGTEMLRVAKDGFYVRGERVPVDDKEAETVYNAFKQFLVWAELNRR
jgi:hypothetical protein